MSASPLPHPSAWLSGLAASLSDRFETDGKIEGVAGGTLWLSLRVGGRFVWLLCQGEMRAAWMGQTPASRDWLQILQRHADSPFARRLRGRRLVGAVALENPEGKLDGLRLDLDDRGHIGLRFFPRPGALWLEEKDGELGAQQGRMDGPPLRETPKGETSFAAEAHAARCEAALEEFLAQKLGRWLESELRRDAAKRTRRLLAQEADLSRAESLLDLREKADLLAAHLHEIEPRQSRATLDGFQGQPTTIELDPRLSAAKNLQLLYRRAAKAERTVATLRERLALLHAQDESSESPLNRLQAATSLAARVELAHALGIPLAPSQAAAGRRGRQVESRLPYRSYRLNSGEELRVGRNARDNDALLRHHSSGQDLWLHAQGVEGSHVILRVGGGEPRPHAIEAAARLAAEFSKARNSALVPVLVTQRRYVRKPRKAAPGAVVAERGRTLFVEPGIPEGCERSEENSSD